MNILYKSFHLVDVDNERTVRNDISEDFDSFINDFVDFSNHNEKAKAYVIMHEEDLISDCIQRIVNDTDIEYRNELSDKIALKLLESEKLAQAKIYPTGSKVKRGSLVQALVQNSDDEYEYILAKVEHSEWYDGISLHRNSGFSSEKKSIWKFAIYNMYSINDHIVFNDVSVFTDTKAKYWTVSFLELEEKRDDAFNTYNAYKAIDNELKSAIKTSSPRDYVVLSNEIQNTMNTPQDLNYSNYVEELIDQYEPVSTEIDKEVIKDCLLALPERKHFDTEFKTVPSSIENKRTKKYKIADGVELMIKSTSNDFSSRIISTMKNGKRVLEIVCDDDETYNAFIEENA